MNKRTFVWFGLVVVLLAVLIPWLVFRADGDSSSSASVPADLQGGKELFATNCGTCHTLYSAGTDGNFGPDLDDLLAPSGPPSGSTAKGTIEGNEERTLSAIKKGVDGTTTSGRMPPGILSGEAAEEVAEFVARTAGQG